MRPLPGLNLKLYQLPLYKHLMPLVSDNIRKMSNFIEPFFKFAVEFLPYTICKKPF